MAALNPESLFAFLNFTTKYSNMVQLLAKNVNKRLKLSDESLLNSFQRIVILKFILAYIAQLRLEKVTIILIEVK